MTEVAVSDLRGLVETHGLLLTSVGGKLRLLRGGGRGSKLTNWRESFVPRWFVARREL